jgi:hypothetical protein
VSVTCATRPNAASQAAPYPRPALCGRHGELLLLALVTSLALAVRVVGLGHESVWYDEAYTLAVAARPLDDLVTGRVFDPGNPQGYFVVLHLWQRLWGASSIETARALSALAGALCVPAVWLLARRSGAARGVRMLAAVLVAINPSLVFLSQEARTFALFAAVATLATAFAATIVRAGSVSDGPDRRLGGRPGRGTAGAWCGFTLCGIVLVHLHYYAAFVLIVLGLYLLNRGRRRAPGVVVNLGLAALAAAAAFVPWLPIFYESVQNGISRSADTWSQQLALLPLFTAVGRTLVWKEAGTTVVASVDVLVVVLLFLPAAWLLFWRRRAVERDNAWIGPALAVGLGLPLFVAVVSMVTPMVHTHYLTCMIPPTMVLIAVALKEGVRRRSWVALGGLLMVVGLLAPASLARLYLVQHKENWRALADRVAATAPDLPVFFYEDIGATPYAYYRPQQPRHTLAKPFGEQGEGWQAAGYLDQLRREPTGFWLVFYATNRSVGTEEAHIVAQLQRDFETECDQQFGHHMRLLLCRPHSGPPYRMP